MASVHKRQIKSGVVYDVRYRDPTGGTRQKSFSRKRDADKFRATVVADMARGDWIDPRRARETVADWADKWIASKSGLKPSSRDRCQVTLELRILPRWADTPIGKVAHEDVVAWVAAMDSDGLSASTIKKARGALREILALAVRSGAIRANPVDGVKIPSGPKSEHRYLTPAELEALCHEITNPPNYPSRHYDRVRSDLGLLVRFAAFTGLRLGENLALRVRDIDLVGERATVRQSAAEVRGVMHIGETKTGARRSVPIARSLIEPLAEQLAGRDRNDFVWPNRDGGPLRGSTLRSRHYKPAAARAGLVGLRFHDLRHTCVALLVQLGAHPKAIQEWLGHSSITMTLDQYGHLFPSIEEALAARLDELMFAG